MDKGIGILYVEGIIGVWNFISVVLKDEMQHRGFVGFSKVTIRSTNTMRDSGERVMHLLIES